MRERGGGTPWQSEGQSRRRLRNPWTERARNPTSTRRTLSPRTSAWDHLKRALKGAYEDSVWEHLAGTVSEPFTAGEQKRVAIKVIDDRGTS